MRLHIPLLLLGFGAALSACLSAAEPVTAQPPAPLDLRETVSPSALVDLRAGGVAVAGRVSAVGVTAVTVRVTTSLGASSQTSVPVVGGRFHFNDSVALTMRLGYPAFSLGVSFLF